MNDDEIKNIVEAALLAAGNPLDLDSLLGLFQGAEDPPGRDSLRSALGLIAEDYEGRGIELKEVASGYRVQVRQGYAERIKGLWTERPGRYSRALLETLVLIAYRQPITRGEIEDIRGVAVSTNIMRTLQERNWIRVVGHRDVPGHPAIYGTTREFLDYFNLKSLAELPSLAEIRDIDEITRDLFRDEGMTVPGPARAAEPPGPGGEVAVVAGAAVAAEPEVPAVDGPDGEDGPAGGAAAGEGETRADAVHREERVDDPGSQSGEGPGDGADGTPKHESVARDPRHD